MGCGPHQPPIVCEKNNMNTKEILKKAKGILKVFTRDKGIHAERDWMIVLGVAAGALLISAILNAISFARVYDGEPISRSVNTNPPLRETQELSERLERVEEIFDAREAAQQEFINTSYPFIDPARN